VVKESTEKKAERIQKIKEKVLMRGTCPREIYRPENVAKLKKLDKTLQISM
jgi:hypothetical protein